ncbi:hypothetical protein A3SI_15503 [Nitritalea halalkaliphila LW7]|uniref:Uncharacterized protein n=1 Tax=Nitritalea halalkaliphila LW7 TaxID=1189621 RepID=I5BYE4_9BACT|nr:hypothetical protein [Nitritalea halalkaliphila]EIM74596.1 hypothetical protein A3SI_15503 [Nitritalea halalkaliphila LW7]
MQTASTDSILLRRLWEEQELSLYQLHLRYRLSPLLLAISVRHWQENGILELAEDWVRLTPKGEKWIFAQRKALFFSSRSEQDWKRIPPRMMRRRCSIWKPYFYTPHEDEYAEFL